MAITRTHRLLVAGFAMALAGTALADARQVLMESFGKAFGRGEYRAKIVSQVKGREYPIQIDVQWPDRFHMVNPDSEMILLPGATWMKAGGSWMQMPMDMSNMISGYSKGAVDKGLEGIGEVVEAGSESIDGCDATLYRYRSSGKFMGVDNNAEAEVAICGETGMPVRVRTLEKNAKDSVVIHYDFTSDIDIRAPR